MFKCLMVIFLFTTVYGSSFPERPQLTMDLVKSERIIDSENANITEAPYNVVMLYGNPGETYLPRCGGSIISTSVIVSSAHCLYKSTAENWKVRAGSTKSTSGGQLLNVDKTIEHPNYSGSTADFDISLLFLSSAINLDGVTTKIIPLPFQDAPVIDGTTALVTGWYPSSIFNNLQKATVYIANQEKCTEVYYGHNNITPRMICAGNMRNPSGDICIPDNGPLVIEGVLIGMYSWGLGCNILGYPGVFTRVAALRNWIDSNIP